MTISDPTRKRKRKSRWGERPAEIPTVQDPPKPVIAMINGVPIVVPTVVSSFFLIEDFSFWDLLILSSDFFFVNSQLQVVISTAIYTINLTC